MDNLIEFTQNYLRILKDDFTGLNLTRILDFDDFYSKQILDSIIPLGGSEIFAQSVNDVKRVVDVGFGGGFPLLPLAKLLPDVDFLGLEARGKKAKAVSTIANKLLIDNVSTLHERVENFLFDRPTVITFKAVGTILEFLKRIKHTKRVDVFFYKGPNVQELEGSTFLEIEKNWELIEDFEYYLPSGEKRYLLGYRSRQNSNVPRGTK